MMKRLMIEKDKIVKIMKVMIHNNSIKIKIKKLKRVEKKLKRKEIINKKR